MNFQIKRISSCKPQDKKRPQPSWKHTTRASSSKKYPSDANAFIFADQTTMAYSSVQFKSTPKTMPIQSVKTRNKITLKQFLMSNVCFVNKLRISSTSWCLYDQSKSKYLGFRQKHQRQIASLTKIMTTILSIQFFQQYDLNSQLYVKVTQNASKMIGTSADLKFKTWVKFRDLLYGSMLPSGNDAAFLLSQVVGYLYKLEGNNKKSLRNLKFLDISNQNTTFYTIQFIKLMNKKAQQLQMNSTKFSNPHGLQNALNISCPKDLIILSTYAAKNQLFRKIMNTQYYRYEYVELQKKQDEKVNQSCDLKSVRKAQNNIRITKKIWQNTNLLLKKGWQGVKTGQTGPAGSCLSSLKNGIFIVVLNCRDNESRFSETQKLYNWYIQKRAKQSASTDDEDSTSKVYK